MKAPDLQKTIARMKAEILADIEKGMVPETVSSFSDLHTYVDANTYGGFADEDYLSEVWAYYGAHSDNGCPAEVYDFVNNAQNAINTWLEKGRKDGNEEKKNQCH